MKGASTGYKHPFDSTFHNFVFKSVRATDKGESALLYRGKARGYSDNCELGHYYDTTRTIFRRSLGIGARRKG